MHFCLAVCAAATVVEALLASRALSGPELNGKSATSMATTVNDGPLHCMARPLIVKHDEDCSIVSKNIRQLLDYRNVRADFRLRFKYRKSPAGAGCPFLRADIDRPPAQVWCQERKW